MGKRGNKLRPCIRCGDMVNFVLWRQRSAIMKKRIFHWANEDGSHHTCSIKESSNKEMYHIRSIINGD